MDVSRKPATTAAGMIGGTAETLALMCCAFVAMGAVHNSPLAAWQRTVTIFPFAENAAMLLVPLLWVWSTGRKFALHGFSTADLKGQVEAAVKCGIPFGALAFLRFNVGKWAIIVQMAIGISMLFLFAFLLRKKSGGVAATVPCLLPCLLVAFGGSGLRTAATGVLFYMGFVSWSEEVLFRGAIQSRLNAAFGRPFLFFGVPWGWGALIACVLFGLMHVVNLPALSDGRWYPLWAAGAAMFCLGLPLAFLRERTGGILAPALLHAFPQSIAYAVTAILTSPATR